MDAAAAFTAATLTTPLSAMQQQQQERAQQQLVLHVEPRAWSAIAQDCGWHSIARLSGAAIQVQVNAASPLLALCVSGTAELVGLVAELLPPLLLQHRAAEQVRACA
jgi:hypothetical protein